MVSFQNPWALLLFIPVVAFLPFIIRKNFAKIKGVQQREAFKSKVRQRSFILFTRLIIFSLLIVAIASPFSVESVLRVGDPTITLLVDNSTSMGVFDSSG